MAKQNNNRMSLNNIEFKPILFNPLEYKTVTPTDYNLLKQSFAESDENRLKTESQLINLSTTFNDIKSKIDESEHSYINDLQNKIEDKISKAISYGDYHLALDYTLSGSKNILDDKGLSDRMKATANYNSAMDSMKKQVTDKFERNYLINHNKFKFDENNKYENAEFGVASFNDAEVINKVLTLTSTYHSSIDNGTKTVTNTGLSYDKLYDSFKNQLKNNLQYKSALYQKYNAYKEALINNDYESDELNIMKKGVIGIVNYDEFEDEYIKNHLINKAYNHYTENITNSGRSNSSTGSSKSDEDWLNRNKYKPNQGEVAKEVVSNDGTLNKYSRSSDNMPE